MDEVEIVEEIFGWCWSQYLLPPLALAFSICSIWLCVRIINRRERWAMWALAVGIIAVFIVYPLSIGPASRLSHDPDCPDWLQHELPTFYGPVLRVLESLPDSLSVVSSEYISFWQQNR